MTEEQQRQLEWDIDRRVDAWMRDEDRPAAWHAHGIAQGIAIALGVATGTSREAVWTAAMDRYQNAIASGEVNEQGYRYEAGAGYVQVH